MKISRDGEEIPWEGTGDDTVARYICGWRPPTVASSAYMSPRAVEGAFLRVKNHALELSAIYCQAEGALVIGSSGCGLAAGLGAHHPFPL